MPGGSSPCEGSPDDAVRQRDLTVVYDEIGDVQRIMGNARQALDAYQASLATNEWNANDTENFSHAVPRRLSAEELEDALTLATGRAVNAVDSLSGAGSRAAGIELAGGYS